MIAVMRILNINTIYIDEIFSGASEDNMDVLSDLISLFSDFNVNIVMIVQNSKMVPDNVNYFKLIRNLDNSVTIEGS